MSKMIVVTGGAGFIGSAFVARLNQEGISNVVIVDALRDSSKWKNLVSLSFVDFVHKDIFIDLLVQEQLPFEIDAIVHMGACSSTTETNADYLIENNFHYTKILAEYCVDRDIRFIYASSAATYGIGENGYEDDVGKLRSLRPLNMYGYSKHLFDLWAEEQGYLNNISGIKFFNVFGPNEYHKGDMQSMVLKAFDQIAESGAVKLFKSKNSSYKDGEQKRDFVYIKDCVDVLFWLLQNPAVSGLFNLGSGSARTWNDLVGAVFKAMEKARNIQYIDIPQSLEKQYQYFTEAPMEKLRGAGYKIPFTSLEDGVTDYVKNYLGNSKSFLTGN